MVPIKDGHAISRLGGLFLVVNLLLFPVVGQLLSPALQRVMDPQTTPLWILAALPATLGLVLIGANVGLLLAARRVAGWNGETAAMAVWTGLCVATFVLLGAYSPLNLALRLLLRGFAGH